MMRAPLLKLRWLQMRRGFASMLGPDLLKTMLLAASGSVFIIFEYAFFLRIFHFLFSSQTVAIQFIARALSLQLLNLVFMVFVVMLFFSNMITSISVFLASSDMKLLLVYPIRASALYLHKCFETLVRSSGIIAIFIFPVLISYGVARGAGWIYYLVFPIPVLFAILFPCSLAIPIMLTLARIFPTRRLQQGLIGLFLILMTVGLFVFRFLLMEDAYLTMSKPDELLRWATVYSLPDSRWLPANWVVQTVDALTEKNSHTSLFPCWPEMLLSAGLSLGLSTAAGAWLLRSTWSRSFGVSRKSLHTSGFWQFGQFQFPLLARDDNAMMLKEIKIFCRDISRWSQIIMMLPLIGFYLVNIHLLPFRDQFREIYFLLNLFMIAFIQAAIGGRYLFPSISWEGPAWWILKVSPYSIWRLVIMKYVFLCAPLVALTIALCCFSFHILEFETTALPNTLIMALGTTLLISALAVGMGAALPKFKYEHHLEISLGPGGILYMLLALTLSTVYIGILSYPALAAMGERKWDWGLWTFSTLHPPHGGLVQVWLPICAAGIGLSLGIGIWRLSAREETAH